MGVTPRSDCALNTSTPRSPHAFAMARTHASFPAAAAACPHVNPRGNGADDGAGGHGEHFGSNMAIHFAPSSSSSAAAAASTTLTPHLSLAAGSADVLFSSTDAACMCPFLYATCRGVQSLASAYMFAPFAASTSIFFDAPAAAAKCIGVHPAIFSISNSPPGAPGNDEDFAVTSASTSKPCERRSEMR